MTDILLRAVLFIVREAVKLPVMWKLWSREDVNKLRRQHTHRSETLSRSLYLDTDCKTLTVN